MTKTSSRITKVECFQVAWPDATTFPRRSAWVRIHDDSGHIGLGEASPMNDGDMSLSFVQRHLAPGLIGLDPFDSAMIQARALHSAMKLGPHGIVAAALAAVDIALWDLKGQLTGLPIYKLLGGAWTTELPFYASVGGLGSLSVDATLKAVERHLAIGPSLVKIRMEHRRGLHDVDVAGDIAKARAVRDMVGPDFKLAFDASNGYSHASALRVGRVLEQLDYVWYEEPVEHYQPGALRAVAERLDIPVSAGEQSYTLQDLVALADAGVTILQPDIIKMGGFTGMLDCKALAQALGIALVPHQTQPVIGHLANLHFVAAQFQSTYPCELNDPGDRQHGVFRNPPRPVDGRYRLCDAPGLGLEVDEGALKGLVHAVH